MALGGSIGPRASAPRFVRLPSGLMQSLASASADPIFPEEAWVLSSADPDPPEIKVRVSEDTQLNQFGS